MRRIIWCAGLLIVFATAGYAQGNPTINQRPTAPASCPGALPLSIISVGNAGAGNLYGNSGSGSTCALLATPKGAGGTISDITSTGGTLTISNPAGPTTNIDINSGVMAPPYTGLVTTGTGVISYDISASNIWWNQATPSIFRTNTPSVKIVWGNFSVTPVPTGNVETAIAGNSTYKAAIEWPVAINNSYSITTGNILNVVAPNSFQAGDTIQGDFFLTSTFINGVTLTVSATGLSSSGFQATGLTHANVASTVENGLFGIITPCTFGGNATTTVSGLVLVTSDACLPPAGRTQFTNDSMVLVRALMTNSSGTVYASSSGNVSKWPYKYFWSDAFGSGATTDRVYSGALSLSGGQATAWTPIALVGTTSKPSVVIVGDSIPFGAYDAINDYSEDSGEENRYIGPYFAYANLGVDATAAQYYLVGSNATLRNLFINTYATHVIDQYGINDLVVNSVAAATIAGYRSQIAGLFPGKVVIGTTLPAETADTWVVTSNTAESAGSVVYSGTFTNCGSNACVNATAVWSVSGTGVAACNGGPWAATASTAIALTLSNSNASCTLQTAQTGAATDNWTSYINQTPRTSPDTLNGLIRAGIAGEQFYFDPQKAIDPQTLDKWPINYNLFALPATLGTVVNFATADGTHATAIGDTIIKQSSVINPLIITR